MRKMDRKLEDIKRKIEGELEGLQVEIQRIRGELRRLFEIYREMNDEPATDKQKNYLVKLGFPRKLVGFLGKKEASKWIDRLKKR